MTNVSKYIALKEFIPIGLPKISQFELKTETLHLNNSDEVYVKNKWISVDPFMRARMTERKNYMQPYEIGKPMEGKAIGEVIEANSSNYKKGDIVISNYGWRDSYISKEKNLKKINITDIPLQA